MVRGSLRFNDNIYASNHMKVTRIPSRSEKRMLNYPRGEWVSWSLPMRLDRVRFPARVICFCLFEVCDLDIRRVSRIHTFCSMTRSSSYPFFLTCVTSVQCAVRSGANVSRSPDSLAQKTVTANKVFFYLQRISSPPRTENTRGIQGNADQVTLLHCPFSTSGAMIVQESFAKSCAPYLQCATYRGRKSASESAGNRSPQQLHAGSAGEPHPLSFRRRLLGGEKKAANEANNGDTSEMKPLFKGAPPSQRAAPSNAFATRAFLLPGNLTLG